MRRTCMEEELLEKWTLAPDERLLIAAKSGSHGLAFALLFKFMQAEGRFPRDPFEIPVPAIAYVAKQLQVSTDSWSGYDWKGRTIKYHRAAIRGALGFRESTLADAELIMAWASEHIFPLDGDFDRIKAEILSAP